MASFHDAQGFRGNQGEEEDVNVISVEPIVMIVPPELQDSPRTAALEGNASSSVSGGSEGHQPSTSSDSPTEETSSGAEGVEKVGCSAPVTSAAAEVVVFEGWESKVLSGRLDNLRKAPKTLLVGFKFRAVLHHEVADGAATVKGYKKLEEMVRRFHIPRTILIRAGTPNERACSVSRTGWVPVYVDHFDAGLRFPLPGLLFDVLAEDACKGGGLQVALLVLFVPVHQWDEVFVFVRDTRTDKINNELAARLSEWRTPNTYMNYPQLTSGDVDLKNRLLDYVKARGQQRQTWFDERPPAAPGRGSQHSGFHHRSSSSSQRPRAEQRVEPAPSSSRRRAREDSDADVEDNVPLIRRRTSTGAQPAFADAARPASVHQVPTREVVEAAPTSSSVVGPRIAYRNGFSYARTECQIAMLQGMQNFVPPADRLRAKGHVQQHGGHVALIKLMDAFSYTVALFECEQGARAQNNELQHNCKQLAFERASLADEVSCLQSSEMANRAASAESRVDELARKVTELREELDRARAEKESGIQAVKDEAGRAEDRARKAEVEKERTLHELSGLRERVSLVDQHVAQAEASLERTKRLHQCDVCFAHAQGAEWLVGADMFQDAVAVAEANTTTDIFNEVRGKVLGVRADFPIGKLAFFEGEEIDADGKSLAQPANTRVKLKWELNKEGLPVWPPSVVEEGKDTEGLPSFDAWVADPHDVPAEPSSTPSSAQP
ncbi:hypothetical protein SLEP1_g57388 [Rubroshorea leprosula]|uniref:Uncharacterized protein n=1 Tax=Rubroshorea leprosula TaxID=152421 RepID=A0AAV5MLJ8_9ROSI|nr:hypothetical protein SLEP1_g57388 [Rubroshorea leprosula]